MSLLKFALKLVGLSVSSLMSMKTADVWKVVILTAPALDSENPQFNENLAP